ncbi:MAG: DUF4369 domain-containing protein, partial [Sphingobacteriaceae bacterium]
MHKFFLLVGCSCLLQMAIAQPGAKTFSFSGSVANTPTGYVYLSYVDSANQYIEDSAQLHNGKFSFKGYLNGPSMASFKGKTASESVD